MENQEKIIFTSEFAPQKFEYIHNNPVDTRRVTKKAACIYSSAGNYYYWKYSGLIKIGFLVLTSHELQAKDGTTFPIGDSLDK